MARKVGFDGKDAPTDGNTKLALPQKTGGEASPRKSVGQGAPSPRKSLNPGVSASPRKSLIPGQAANKEGNEKKPQNKGTLIQQAAASVNADSIFGALRRGQAVNVGFGSIMIEQDLMEVPMFKACSASFVSALAQDASETTKAFSEGQIIQEAGAPGKSMVLLTHGAAQVMKKGEVLMNLKQGDHYGETMLLGLEQVWRVSLVSLSSSMIIEIRRDSFRRILEDFPVEIKQFESFFDVTLDQLFSGTRTNTCDIFTGLSMKTLEVFDEHILRRVFFPGETVLQEGDDSKELVLLQDGMAVLEIAGRNVRTETRGMKERREGRSHAEEDKEEEEDSQDRPACFGELEFLGLSSVRKTEVKALTPCVCRVLHREMVPFMAQEKAIRAELEGSLLMQMFHQNVRSTHHAQSSVLGDFVAAKCSEEFLMFLAGHLEARLHPKGKKMCDLNRDSGSKSLQMVMTGSVTVKGVQGKELPSLGVGGVFGRMTALGVRPRPHGAISFIAAEHCCVEVLHQDVVVRGLEIYQDQRSKILMLEQDKNKGNQVDFVEIVANSRIFSNMSHEFVRELSLSAVDRIFMPGDAIMHQGAVEFSMFIMISGTADVYVTDAKNEDPALVKERLTKPVKGMSRVSHLSAGAICGELAMLGITPTRSATILAASLCILWEVTQDKAMAILDRYPQERELFGAVIIRNLDSSVPARLLQLPLFKSFDRKFRMLLTLYCERHAFFPDQHIIREGEVGDKCWIFNLGPAVLQKRGYAVKTFSPGSQFGCDHMLGINRTYCGSVLAMSVCHMLAVSRSSYLLVLEQYPSQKANQQLLRQQRQEAKDLRQAIQRITIRKGIWQRYQGEVAPNKSNNVFFLSEHDLLQRFVKAWHETAKGLHMGRLERVRRRQEVEEMIENWRLKNEANFKKAEHKRREKEILHRNVTERGPLEYLDPKPPSLPALPRLRKKQTQELVSILKAWPSPRPSPHYNLKVWSLMGQELTQPVGDGGSRLLPMLEGVKRRGPPVKAGQTDAESSGSDSEGDGAEGTAASFSPLASSSRENKAKRLNELMAATQASRASFLG